jgi:hypothetical protein
VTLLAEIMGRYLYAEDVKRLAWEHGLPTSRTKDELIDELIASGDVVASEVVAFIGVDGLRQICQELGLPSGAGRDVLAARIVGAIEPPPTPRRTQTKSRVLPTPDRARPVPQAKLSLSATIVTPRARNAPPELVRTQGTAMKPGRTVVVHVTEVPRKGWLFVTLATAVVLAGAAPFALFELGILAGSLAIIGAGIVVVAVLLFTSRKWIPWLDRRLGTDSPSDDPAR